jgi:hypothetical protein
MEVRIKYMLEQLDEAAKFIAQYNKSFLGQVDYIKGEIFASMEACALDPESTMRGTMGFYVYASRDVEDVEHDENVVHFNILVDPALRSPTRDEYDFTYENKIVIGEDQ